MMRVGIYGGSFSPVHNGHIAAAKAFMEQMWLDILYIIPANLPPHKELAGGASAIERLEMCDLAFKGIDGIVVSDMEMRRGGKSYTVDTLRELSDPDRKLFLLCGTDMMLSLDTWYKADEIFKLCQPVYIRRENDRGLDAQIIAKVKEYQDKYGKVVRRIVTDPIEISSTQVRERIAGGHGIGDLVPSSVARYIRVNGIYKESDPQNDN